MLRFHSLVLSACLLISHVHAQHNPVQKSAYGTYNDFLRRILREQGESAAAAKGAALKDRLIAASSSELNGTSYDFIDSLHYKYSGSRGSALSPNDDQDSYSYCDNSNAFVYDGLEGPAASTLSYDTGYAAVPGGSGRMYIQMVKTYDAAGYLSTYTMLMGVSSSGPYYPTEYCQYTYDASHHCTSVLQPGGLSIFSKWSGGLITVDSLYDFMSGAPYEKVTYTYNAAGKVTLAFSQKWNGASWDNESKYVATYDASNRLSTSINIDWQVGAWQNKDKDSFSYTGSNNTYTFRLNYAWDGSSSTFTPVTRFTARLTPFGAMDTLYTATYTGGSYTPNNRIVFAYNNYQHLTSTLWYAYNGSSYETVPGYKNYYYYQTYNSTGVGSNEQSLADEVVLFPNPVKEDEVHLMFKSASATPLSIAIIDVTGRQIASQNAVTDANIIVPVKGIPAGVYYMLLQRGERMQRVRFVRE